MASVEVGLKCQTCNIKINNLVSFYPRFRLTGKAKQTGWLYFKVRPQINMRIANLFGFFFYYRRGWTDCINQTNRWDRKLQHIALYRLT